MPQQQSVPQETPEEHSSDCCAEAFASGSAKSTVAEAMTAFQSMIAAVGKDGTLDARTKELILFALVVMARCGPCVELHLKKAKSLGFSQEQLDEAVWCATAIGGAPVWMFYQKVIKNKSTSTEKSCCQ